MSNQPVKLDAQQFQRMREHLRDISDGLKAINETLKEGNRIFAEAAALGEERGQDGSS